MKKENKLCQHDCPHHRPSFLLRVVMKKRLIIIIMMCYPDSKNQHDDHRYENHPEHKSDHLF